MLTVSVTGKLNFGESTVVTVDIYTPNGNASKTFRMAPPKLVGAELSVTDNHNGTCTYTITATASMTDGSELTEGMILTADLIPYTHSENPLLNPVVSISMTPVSGNPSQYTATYTCPFPTDPVWLRTASVLARGYWDQIEEDTFRQTSSIAVKDY